MLFEVIKLTDVTSLSTFAYIECTGNRFDVFCDYIQYCFLRSGTTQFTLEELHDKFIEYFSLAMPYHFCEFCLKQLMDRDIVEHKNSLYILQKSSFDADAYDIQLKQLQLEENTLNECFRQYAKTKNKEWSLDEAKAVLSSFIFSGSVASDIFINKSINVSEIDEKQLCIPDSWYAGSFVSSVLDMKLPKSAELKQYLLKVNTGVMICLAVSNNTEDVQKHRKQRRTNPKYYLDTRLALRCLGYSDSLHVKETRELVELIRKDQGSLAVTAITFVELSSALYNACDALARGVRIQDDELYAFSIDKKIKASVMKGLYNSLTNSLDSQGILIDDGTINWSDSKAVECNIDCADFRQHIKTSHDNWNDQAIDNDVTVISYLYYQRLTTRNNSIYFVTTNISLVSSVKSFFNTLKISKKQAPIISDTILMCKLWLPLFDQLTDVPQLVLAERAYAAKRPSPEFCAKMQDIIRQYSDLTKTNIIFNSLDDLEQFEDHIITISSGDITDFTGSSIKEHETLLEKRENLLKDELSSIEGAFAISLAEQAFASVKPQYSLRILYILQHLPIILSAAISLLSLLIGVIFSSVGLLVAGIFCLVAIILGIISSRTDKITCFCLTKFKRYLTSHARDKLASLVAAREEYKVSDSVDNAAKELLDIKLNELFLKRK